MRLGELFFFFFSAASNSDGGTYGDPLCALDGYDVREYCDQLPENHAKGSCWREWPDVREEFLCEFFAERCCNDKLSASALKYGEFLEDKRVFNLVHDIDRPGVIIVRDIPGLSDLLTRSAASWYDFNETPSGQHVTFENDVAVAASLSQVVRWLVDALIRDLVMANASGAVELTQLLCGSPLGHVRHFEYNNTDWGESSNYVDASRWMPYFHIHKDSFWVSVQTQPSIRGVAFHDGTFAVDKFRRMHRVRLGPADVAVWFGTVVESISNGAVRAAQHMVLAHHSYRRDLDSYGRRVTMFHVYPHNRDADVFRHWAKYGPPLEEKGGKLWYENETKKRASLSNVILPGGICLT